MHTSFLLLGTNLGDRPGNLTKAREKLNESGTVLASSGIFESEPWGKEDQPNFLNQAVKFKSRHDPAQLLKLVKEIERSIGRTDSEKWEPRIIDIDILLFDDISHRTKELVIPHPQLPDRNFALIPLMEIAGNYFHPLEEKTIEELYDSSGDTKEVYIFSGQ